MSTAISRLIPFVSFFFVLFSPRTLPQQQNQMSFRDAGQTSPSHRNVEVETSDFFLALSMRIFPSFWGGYGQSFHLLGCPSVPFSFLGQSWAGQVGTDPTPHSTHRMDTACGYVGRVPSAVLVVSPL